MLHETIRSVDWCRHTERGGVLLPPRPRPHLVNNTHSTSRNSTKATIALPWCSSISSSRRSTTSPRGSSTASGSSCRFPTIRRRSDPGFAACSPPRVPHLDPFRPRRHRLRRYLLLHPLLRESQRPRDASEMHR